MKRPPQERFAESSGPSPAHMALMYGVMIVGAIVLFLAVDSCGEGLVAGPGPPGARDSATGGGKPDALVHVLVALTAVLLTGRLLSLLFLCVRQPPVIGEVIGGILLGPSVLGRLWPEAAAFVLPPSVAPFLGVIAHLGVILYMFLVGLELKPGSAGREGPRHRGDFHASIIVPFLLGITLSPASLSPALQQRRVIY